MAILSVRLFGQFSVCYGAEAFQDSIPCKARELFCYLLTHRQRPLGREFLASILWEDCTTEHSKQYLRKALWQLQRALCRYRGSAEDVLQVTSQCVSLSPKADIWVDVVEFERSCFGAQSSSWRADESGVEALETAVNLYRGDLLEGWYEDWCLYDRERLQNVYLLMLDKLVGYAEERHRCEKGIDYATRILQCDRARENAHRQLMRLRYLSGDRSGALRQYEICVAALREELSVIPSEQTHTLYRQIRDEQISVLLPPLPANSAKPREEASLLQGAANRLQEVKTTLAALQRVVDEGLLHLGQALQSSNNQPGASNKNRS